AGHGEESRKRGRREDHRTRATTKRLPEVVPVAMMPAGDRGSDEGEQDDPDDDSAYRSQQYDDEPLHPGRRYLEVGSLIRPVEVSAVLGIVYTEARHDLR